MIVQDAPAPDNRQAAGSKRHLAACLACALLACVSVAPLLRWFSQQQILDANATVVLFNDLDRHAAWTTFHWAKHPNKCLDIAGDNIGAQLQIWSCSDSFPKKQRFVVPPTNSKGEIKWATNPELCLDNPEGVALQMWNCSMTPKENRLFLISTDGNGHSHIRLAARPSKCVDIPNGITDDGWKVQLWDCDDASGHGREDNIAFATISQPCKVQAKNVTENVTLNSTTLDPTHKYLSTSRRERDHRSGTSSARLHITFLLASLPLALYSQNIN